MLIMLKMNIKKRPAENIEKQYSPLAGKFMSVFHCLFTL